MDIRVTTTTSAPPERVWQLLADLDGWPRWLPTVDRLEPVTPGAEPGLGAAYLVKQPRLPLARGEASSRSRKGAPSTASTFGEIHTIRLPPASSSRVWQTRSPAFSASSRYVVSESASNLFCR